MADFFTLLLNAKNIYDTVNTINDILVDKMKDILNSIGEKEFQSALKTLDDAKYSTKIEREIESTITQLRLAHEKLSPKKNKKFEVAILISFCYSLLREENLSYQFKHRAKEAFYSYIAEKRDFISRHGKPYWRAIYMDMVKEEFDKLGIKYDLKESQQSFWASLWHDDIDERADYFTDSTKKYFDNYISQLRL